MHEKLDFSNLDQNEHVILSGYLVPDPVLGSGYILVTKKISSLSLRRTFQDCSMNMGALLLALL